MKNLLFKLIFFYLLSTLLWACQAQTKDFDKVIYRYQDSSVAPEFYRSYTIVWQAEGKGFLSVYVYGDTIAQQNFEIKAEDFKKLQNLAKNIQSGGTKTSEASGTSHQLIELFAQKKKVYSRYWDNLNKEAKTTASFVDFIKAKTPNLEKLLATPYNVETTSKKENFAKAEYEELKTLKAQLEKVTSSEEEKEILNKIWKITRKHTEIVENKKPPYKFALQMKQKGDEEDAPIRFKVYAEYYDTPEGASWEERVVWEIDFIHKLLDTKNYYLLLRE